MKRVRLVIVTGLSGSGKTAALKALEDLNFFCVDNLPVALLPKFLELSVFSGGDLNKVALGMDLRERHLVESWSGVFAQVEGLGVKPEVLFLDASDPVLVRRFSETRRRHPLAEERSVMEGIEEERRLLQNLKECADLVIDTSATSVHDLKKAVWNYFKGSPEDRTLQVNLVSFGYRHGIPMEADLLLDVRFLPNPFFVPELKQLTGMESGVQEYVLRRAEAEEFLAKFGDLVAHLIPLYEKEGKTYLTIAFGCTGGKHRSVSIVEELSRRLRATGRPVQTLHRDVEK
ncbi:MAG: RNase adapter RapZ [Deltaproteobacteria bacterium]|nr:RNase adapter RapZ [Deltaproteobacteria bacterium]